MVMISLMRAIAWAAVSVSLWIRAIFSLIPTVASAVSSASFLTSPATTANPSPASPERAASIDALRASRCVWRAIVLITSVTLPISIDDSPSLRTVSLTSEAMDTASEAMRVASAALVDTSRRLVVSCSAPAAADWTLLETCCELVVTASA